MEDCEFNYGLCHYFVLLSVVLRNDGEINVIDHARVVKTFRDPLSSLRDYLSVIYRNASSILASISQP